MIEHLTSTLEVLIGVFGTFITLYVFILLFQMLENLIPKENEGGDDSPY